MTSLRLVATALAALTLSAGLAPLPARALPIATGSNCSSDWVNNAGAMACFIQGEEETRNGMRHPHYVACAGGDIFCCVDNDAGAQNCEAQAKTSRATQAQWIQAILGAHKTMLTRMGRYTARKTIPLQGKATSVPQKSPD